MTTPNLTPLLEAFADMVAARVIERLRATDQDMVSQTRSPLGSRRHCAAVRRRVAAGQHGAFVVGRKHLLTQEALQEELAMQKPRNLSVPVPATPSIADELSSAIAQMKRPTNLSTINEAEGSRRSHPSCKIPQVARVYRDAS